MRTSRLSFFSQDPLIVMLTISVAAGLFILLAGQWLGFRATFSESSSATALEVAPDFRLTDQAGQERSLAQFQGGPVVLTFLFTTCPDVCPIVADKLSVVAEMMGRDAIGVTFLAVSVDPEGDTAEATRSFSQLHGPAQGWYFLTGSREDLSAVWKAYHVGIFTAERDSPTADGDSPMHGAPIYVIDSEGYQRLIYSPSFNPEGLARDLRLLMGANAGVPTIPFGLW